MEEIVFVASASSVSKWHAGAIHGIVVPTAKTCQARASLGVLAAHRAVGWVVLWDESRLAGLFRKKIVFVAFASSVSKWYAGIVHAIEVPTGYICLARARFVAQVAHADRRWFVLWDAFLLAVP